MKKVLLSAFALSAALMSNGQGIFKGNVDKSGYAFDSFESTTAYSDPEKPDFGIFLWKDSTNIAMPYIFETSTGWLAKEDGVYEYKTSRVDGVIKYDVSQPYGLFKPQLGVGFGTGYSLDLSTGNNQKVKIGLKFDLASFPASGIKLKFGIKDATGKSIDSKGTKGGATNQYLNEIAIAVSKAGAISIPADMATVITTDNTTEAGVTYITIDFEGGYEASYPDADVVNERCVGAVKGTNEVLGANPSITGFDPKQVVGFQMTVLANGAAPKCYFNPALLNTKFDLTSFSIGDLTASIEDEKLFAAKGFVAYPNPAKGGVVKFSANAENVKVYDVLGNVVFSAPSASEINVDTFNKGLYVVKSSKGATRFVVE